MIVSETLELLWLCASGKSLDELEKLAMEMKDVGKLSPQDFIRLLQHVNLKYDKRLEEISFSRRGSMQRLSKQGQAARACRGQVCACNVGGVMLFTIDMVTIVLVRVRRDPRH
jgi:hypothetical protein